MIGAIRNVLAWFARKEGASKTGRSVDQKIYRILTHPDVKRVVSGEGLVTVTPYKNGHPICGNMLTAQKEGVAQAVRATLGVDGVDAVNFYSANGPYTYIL